MDDLSCLLVVRKKYANVCGKDSKRANPIDISITEFWGRGSIEGIKLSVQEEEEGVGLSIGEEVDS